MHVAWVHYPLSDGMGQFKGIAKGYQSSAVAIYSALRKTLGADLVDAPLLSGAHPKVHLHYCPPHQFRPIPGKTNVLFSMWEGPLLPDLFVYALRSAQLCLVPSRFCAEVWAQQASVNARVVPLAANDVFSVVDPSRPMLQTPTSRVRFLWLGSRISRKGWERLAPAWAGAFDATSRVALTIKTIGDGTVREHNVHNVTIDQRDLNQAELLDLYRAHDVYVCTSYGEGFGLPAIEAMATGCLYVGTDATGLGDFVSSKTGVIVPRREKTTASYGDDRKFSLDVIAPEDLGRTLHSVYGAWGHPALEAIRLRGTEVARTFTWDRTARELLSAIDWRPTALRIVRGSAERLSVGGAECSVSP
jgi:glycosyltransferase involved in cell wall biosynthesis